MDCPRCGGDLVSYELEGEEAVVCEGCGYVGVPADHRPEGEEPETWTRALRRFRERHRAEREAGGERVALEVDGETYRVAPAVYERYQGLTEKQRAVIRELLAEPEPTEPERTLEEIGEAAGVAPSYVGTVVNEYGDVAAALSGD